MRQSKTDAARLMEQGNMVDFSPKKSRRLLLGYLGVGYVVYAFGLLVSGHADWLSAFMLEATTVISSLGIDARVSADPLAAQLVILYVTSTWLPIALYVTFRYLKDSVYLKFTQENILKSGQSKTKMIFVAIGILIVALFCMCRLSFSEGGQISWRDHSMFSTSFGAVSFLLFLGALVSVVIIPMGITIFVAAMRIGSKNYRKEL